MDTQTPETGAQPTASPTVTPISYAEFSTQEDARDVGQSTGEKAAAPPAAQPADQAASTDADGKPAPSEAAAPASTPQKPPKNAETRTAQLKTENAELQEQLRIRRALREELASLGPTNAPKAESQPAQPESEWERYARHPNAPKPEQFADQGYEAYVVAMSRFIAKETLSEHTQQQQHASQRAERETEITAIMSGFAERVETFAKTDPEFHSKVDDRLLAIPTVFQCLQSGQKPGLRNAIAEEIAKSDVSPQLLMHFSTDEGRKEFGELLKVGQTDMTAMMRRFGGIEARFETRAEPAAPAVPAKTVTSAPEPPTVLGRKPVAPADPSKAAMARGDFSAFMAAEDEKDLAVMRR